MRSGCTVMQSQPVRSGVLPDVECSQMKSKRPYFSQQRIESQRRQVLRPALLQAAGNQSQVRFKLLRAGIRIWASARARLSQTDTNIGQEPSIKFSRRDASQTRGLLSHA